MISSTSRRYLSSSSPYLWNNGGLQKWNATLQRQQIKTMHTTNKLYSQKDLSHDVPTLELNNGIVIPQVGFGLWKVGDNTADIVYDAIKAGYRLFDGAFGIGIKRAINEGIVKREDHTIVSKLWNTFHEKSRVEAVTTKQLEWWGIDYFDIFYMHFPVALQYVDPTIKYPTGWANIDGNVKQTNVPVQETWQAMENLVDTGLIKSIGISNFQGSLVMDLLRYARIRPALLQVEIHPYLIQEELVKLAQSENIQVIAYSSFGPQSFVELKWDKAIECPKLFDHPVIVEIATAHHKTPAQVLLRWAIQRGLAVIPKSTKAERLTQNLECTSFELTHKEMQDISGLNQNLQFNNPADYFGTLYIFA